MPGRFFDWTPDDAPASIFAVDSADAWSELRSRYDPFGVAAPLERLFDVVRVLGAVDVVIERRYIDADYRSEHSQFYSTTFKRYPSVCHRLHFFSAKVEADLSNLGDLKESYLGYSVMRPTPLTPVGRTVVNPPVELSQGTVCCIEDSVDLLGTELVARGMPFVSQDAQYLVCAHAAEWMVLYHAHAVHDLPRRLPVDIHQSAFGGDIAGRQVPSEGLSVGQILGSLHALGISASRIELPKSKEASQDAGFMSLPALVCRYVNSQLPPIVLSRDHAWVIVGYTMEEHLGDTTHDRIVLWRHDDSRGPYIRVEDPWDEQNDMHKPWGLLVPPLPQKSYLTAEMAENLGRAWLTSIGGNAPTSPLGERHTLGRLTFRTYCIRSRRFKQEIAARGLPDDVVRLYQFTHMPRYVWVVEAMDRDLRDDGQPAVLGEVVLDATAHQHSKSLLVDDTPLIIGHTLLGAAATTTPDHEHVISVTSTASEPYASGCAAASV